MGYRTSYELSIVKSASPMDQEGVIHQLREGSQGASYGLRDDGSAQGGLRWYEHEDDLRGFSRKYPELIFRLSGEGEDSGDIWDKYFQNGKMQECKAEIVKPSFDPTKLK